MTTLSIVLLGRREFVPRSERECRCINHTNNNNNNNNDTYTCVYLYVCIAATTNDMYDGYYHNHKHVYHLHANLVPWATPSWIPDWA